MDAAALDYFDACKGFLSVSYHYVVPTSGRIEIGRSPQTRTSRGSYFQRQNEIWIGVVGGRDEEGNRVSTETPEQRDAVEELIQAVADCLQTSLVVTDYVADKTLRDQLATQEEADIQREAELDASEALNC